YGEIAPFDKFYNHLVYSTVHPDVAPKGVFFSYQNLAKLRQALGSGQQAAIDEVAAAIRAQLDNYEESLVLSIDSDLFVAHFLNLYENLPKDMHPEIFAEIASGYLAQPEEEEVIEEAVEEVVEEKKKKKKKRPFWKRGKKEIEEEELPVMVIEEDPMAHLSLEERVQAWTDAAYEVALAVNLDQLAAFLESPDLDALNQDPLLRFSLDMISTYVYQVARSRNVLTNKLDGLYKDYLIALRQMYPDKTFYPDANSTMRVSYGTVESYRPRDGVVFQHYTTLGGAIEKEDEAPEDPDYNVPSKLRKLYETKDFGPYGEDELVTCFLNTCESSGGSSGSPVLNGKGELVGIAFDGNWEA
ncbi:MAG: S46 family peptidase, partial [Bacteroidota bacterium]